MAKLLSFIIVTLCCYSLSMGQGVVGKWKTIDDETGEAKSIVSIYKKGDKVYGKIIKLFRKKGQDPDPVCTKCDDDDPRKGKKIIGMVIMTDMEKDDDDEYAGGLILKPDEGTVYRCRIWRDGKNLKVRGYWGIFYRTQTWLPIK